jgi:hypothetical protein
MTNRTSNYNLYKWDKTDSKQTTITEMAANMDVIDSSLAEKASQASLNTTNANVTANASYLTDYINPITYGAKFNGVDDDAPGLTEALKRGNVKIPSGKTVTIKSAVQISNSQRIIDGSECTFNISDNVLAFQVGTLAMSASLINIVIKNMFVVMGNNSSYFLSYNSYFIKHDNIRIIGLTGSGYGAKIYNGFNVTFQEFHITGKASSPTESNISGNTAIGIHVYLSTVGVNPAVSGTVNATNILFDSCLIQRVQYGIKFEVYDGVFDTNQINNVGFSSCDYPFYETGGTDNKFLNQQISMMRAEYCGTALTNVGYLSVNNLYVYNTNYTINNTNANGVSSFSGTINHWCTSVNNSAVIFDNKGILDFSKADNLNYTSNVSQKESSGSYGTILPLKSSYKQRGNGVTTLTINPFYIEVINQTTWLDLSVGSNLIGCVNGSEFYIKSDNNSNIAFPDGTNHRFGNATSSIIHFMYTNGKLVVDGQVPLILKDTVSGVTGISLKDKIHFMNATSNITQFNFNKLGICILYSTTSGVTLSNGSANILNFANLNANNPFDLYNNPLMMIPLDDGSGKGLAIKC